MADNRRLIGYGLIINLFFILSVRDLLAQTKTRATEEEEQIAKDVPKPKMMDMPSTGPVLKFLFCYSWGYRKVFEQYRSALTEQFPHLNIQGGNFDPPLWRSQLSTILLYAKMAFIFIVAFGYNPFPSFGTQTPRFFQWAISNKVYACLMAWFVTGMVENSLLSTGAFELYYNDVPIWSKLESGRIPEFHEVVSMIGQHKSAFQG